ncbi:MAG: tetratricopeptide repeat protein [Planctomycetota bacterium]|jgi:hypothetical protein
MRTPAAGLALGVLVLAALAAAPPARADIVYLNDGRKIEGEVVIEGDTYVITGRSGIKTRVPKTMVREVQKTDLPEEMIAKLRRILEAKGKKATADEWYELGKLASELRLAEDAKSAYEEAISLDADHKAARRRLGQVYYGGTWVSAEEAMTRQGKVKVAGRWVDKDESGGGRSKRPDDQARKNIDKAKAMVNAIGPDYVKCNKCKGSGIAVWITCNQCARSDRKGYCWFGDKYAICDRCKGTARFPGIKCAQCRGLGKYDPSRKRSPKKRFVPNGYRICPTCKGSGVERFAKCLQCARCKYPGYNYFGEKYTICMKCLGHAKVPALWCARCQRSGIVRERK